LPGTGDLGAVVRTFDAPEALDVRFHEIRAKSVLNSVPAASRMPFRWTINAYRGCTHACTYCFARPTHTYLDMDAGRDFEREIVVKVNAPEVARAQLMKASWGREHVAIGTNTDPYQWVESKYRLMPGIWEALRDSGTPCSVLTKSPLVLRDLALLRELNETVGFSAAFSIPTIDEKAWRASEPHTPHPRKRIEAIAELAANGIPTSVLVAPLMPGINDDPKQVDEILRRCTEAGARSISGIGLHLRGETRGVFMDWLRSYRPDLVEHYERLYAKGAYLPPAERQRLGALLRRAPRPLDERFGRRGRDEPAAPRAPRPRKADQTSLF
jgi:DNA repair photolyase